MDNVHRLAGAGPPEARRLRSFLRRAAPALLMFVLLAVLTGGALFVAAWLDQAFRL
jgi:hypothetical protein